MASSCGFQFEHIIRLYLRGELVSLDKWIEFFSPHNIIIDMRSGRGYEKKKKKKSCILYDIIIMNS